MATAVVNSRSQLFWLESRQVECPHAASKLFPCKDELAHGLAFVRHLSDLRVAPAKECGSVYSEWQASLFLRQVGRRMRYCGAQAFGRAGVEMLINHCSRSFAATDLVSARFEAMGYCKAGCAPDAGSCSHLESHKSSTGGDRSPTTSSPNWPSR